MPIRSELTLCAVCDAASHAGRLYTCNDCGMSLHDGKCYRTFQYVCVLWRFLQIVTGLSDRLRRAGYVTYVTTKRTPVRHMYVVKSSLRLLAIDWISFQIYECVLCYEPRSNPRQAHTMTSSYNWAHVICATFIPEVKFVKIDTMKPVEYIGTIHKARWSGECELCHDKRGACIVCGDYNMVVHVQCACNHNFRVAFEIQHYKPTTQQRQSSCSVTTVPSGMFGRNASSGLMVSQVWSPTMICQS